MKASLKEFGNKFPVGTQIAVINEDGSRSVGFITGTPIESDLGGPDMVMVKITMDKGVAKEVTMEVKVDVNSVRPRAIETKKGTEILRVKLTDAERIELGQRIADEMEKAATLEAELDTFKKQQSGKIQAAEGSAANAAGLLRAGYEMRSVHTTKTLDFDLGVAVTIRNDTGVTIETREIEGKEAQREFFGPGEGQVEDKGKPQTQVPGVTPEAVEVGKDLIQKAKAIILETKRASISSIQRRMRISYTIAVAVMDALEDEGFVGPANGDEPRAILKDE
jgi:DNA segregation ATPase FtsK/SpoIIIE-like protein